MLAVAALWPLAARAQVDATQWRSGTVDIDQGWKAQDGDNPAWVKADFDDSHWKTVELDDMGPARPGWQSFRLHLKLASDHPHLHLLLAGGDGSYEVYVNGQKADGPRLLPFFAVKRPTEQVIPLNIVGSDVVLALRTHTPLVYTTWHLPLFLTVALGTQDAIQNEQQAMESSRLYWALPSLGINLVLILAAIGAFALFRSQKMHVEYLWLALYLLLLGLSNLLQECVATGLTPVAMNNLLADPMVYLFTIAQIEFTFSFAGQRVSRFWRGYEGLLLTPLALNALTWIGTVPSTDYLLVEACVILPAAMLLPVFLLVWYRRGNREAGWLILPSLLPLAASSLFDLGTVSIYLHWGVADFLDNPILLGPVQLQPADVGDFLFVLAIGVVMFFRFTRVSREQARGAAELEAARTIQRRLVPEGLPRVAGYVLEAAYFPAQEVGGDFYQVLESEAGALVVVGDASGKGLSAAMTSTMALGALGALAKENLGPGEVLMRLNEQMTETQGEGFITCLCVRLTAEGEVTVANAGHLPPYWNGEEVTLEPDLPLGICAGTQYKERTFALGADDQLTLLSDGVVEAQNARGELLGFERTQALSRETASVIAEVARRFGQADDITVMTLLRVP